MSSGESRTRATLSVAPYRVLLYSATVVVFGVMGQAVARGWLARELTGNNTGLGVVMLAFGASMLLATPFGGVAADRYPKRLVLAASVVALMTTSFAIGVAVVADALDFWMLVVASAAQAIAFAFYLPARITLISEVVPPHLLQNAIVIAQMSHESARVVAPALAGALISVSWFGSGGVFLASGVVSLLAALLVLRLPRPARRESNGQSPLAELIDAAAYLRSDRAVGAIALLTVGVVMVGYPYLTFLPTLADDRFDVGASGFGVMSGAAGLGAFAAGWIVTTRNRGTRPGTTIVASAGAFGISLIALGLANSYALALVALVAVGASGLVFQTSTQALMLRLAPLEYHGRLQSMVILGVSGFGLAALPLGLLADAITLRWTFAGMGFATVLITLWFASVRHRQRGAGDRVDYG
jgi:predicted MFS family arabinose efflux permease